MVMYQFSFLDFVAALILGIPIIAAAGVLQARRFTVLIKAGLVILCIIVLLALSWMLHPSTPMAPDKWWDRNPLRHLVFYVLMMLGIFGSILNKAIEERRNQASKLDSANESAKIPLRLDGWDFVRGALLSWLTYAAVISQIGNGSVSFPTVLIAVQTGFVWETIAAKRLGEQAVAASKPS